MKTSRVPREKISHEAPTEDRRANVRTPTTPTKKTRAQKSVFSQNDTPDARARSPTAISGRKSGGILNRVGPTTAASDIINFVTSDHQLESPASYQRPKTPRLVPFNVGYVPPNMQTHLHGVPPNRTVLQRPGTANLSLQYPKDTELDSNTSAAAAAAEKYQNHYQYQFIGNPSAAASQILNAMQNDNSKGPNTPGDGGMTSRRPKPKPRGNKKPSSAGAKKNPEYVEAPNNFQGPPARLHISKSECSINPLRSGRANPQIIPNNDIRKVPEWLVKAATRDPALEKLAKSTDTNANLTSSKSKSGTKIGLNDNPMIITTVKVVTPNTNTSNRVSTMSRGKPIVPFNSPTESKSSLVVESRSRSQISIQRTPSMTGKVGAQKSQTEIGTTISSRSKTKPTVRKPVQKKIDAKVFDGPAVSRAIRSAVTAIKDTPPPQRMKRIPVTPVKVKSPVVSSDSLKEKDSTSLAKSKTKKPLKGKGKKGGKKSVTKLNTPTNEFLGAQHQVVDQQLRNLCERQKVLEREVFILFEGLQTAFCIDAKKGNDSKCCCSSETQEKMKSLIQKQKEVIQLQIDLRKRYGIHQLGSAFQAGPNEPLLNGFNAHFGQLASYAREIDGKMGYYCAACNVACDNELGFRRHVESTNHVLKTCKGIKSTQPVFTCDDCEAKMQGTTKYMSHVINSNVHNPRAQSSSSTAIYD